MLENVCTLQSAAHKLLSDEGHTHHMSHSKKHKHTRKSIIH